MSTEPVADNVTWDLTHLYPAPYAQVLEEDRLWCAQQVAAFSAEYRGKVSSLSSSALLDALRWLERIQERAQKFTSFGYLNFSTQTQNADASAVWQSVQEAYSLLYRDVLFFDLEWVQVEDSKAEELLADPVLAHYRHYLEALRRYRPHLLGEPEERLLAEREPVGAASWCTLFDKILSQHRFGRRKRGESEVLSDLYHPEREVRKQAAEDLTEGLEGILHILTHTFNTLLLDKAITDRIRNYPHWIRSRNLANEADDRMVEALVSAVTSRYDLVHRYYSLKRSFLGYDQLYDYDRYAPLPGLPDDTFSWDQARRTVLDAFGGFSPAMREIASNFFEGRWIHAPVLAGKRSGAFAHPTVPGVHPYVFLNYSGRQRDIMTLAHELGHGVHQYLAREQGLFNADTPLTTAESASVFGEMLVFRHLLTTLDQPRQRLALLFSKLEDIFATVFRQIAMNRFEDTVHTARRARGELDSEFLSTAWMETQSAMFGDSVTLLEHYRIWWSYIPHFLHSPGYVYAYAFGELLVLALYSRYMSEGERFVPLYLDLLRSGGKERPEDLLEPFGVDLSDPLFWHQGLGVLETLLAEAEAEAARI